MNNNKKVTLKSLAETVESLAGSMEALFKDMDAKMSEGFKNMDSKMTEGFKKVDKDIESLALMTAESFATVTEDINGLKQSMTNIQQRVDNLTAIPQKI